ncbi:hypothetical protein DFJ63DRAFT_337509 [Scheffersomyces coipomensis]|uniref:uncharacterized protein n=1 Tax=Scheffersomyces coipomensis TaxID=1788519 RepID=UPI00315DEC2A
MFNNILRRNNNNSNPTNTLRNASNQSTNITTGLSNQPAPRLGRSNSQESLSTLVTSSTGRSDPNQSTNQHNDDSNSDLMSLYSDAATVINVPIEIMRRPLPQYKVVRQLPLISTFLHSGTMVFKSLDSFNKYAELGSTNDQQVKSDKSTEREYPLLQTFSSKLSLLKLNSPILTILKYKSSTEKYEFVKVYFKVLTNHINYYILKFFNDNGQVIDTIHLLNNNSNKPTVDFNFEHTNFRIVGITGTSSTFGTNGLIKLYVMKNDEVLLCNDKDIEINDKDQVKFNRKRRDSMDEAIDESSLYSLIESQDKLKISKYIDSQTPLINIPMSQYLDEGNIKMEKHFIKNGTIKIFDYDTNEISDENIKLVCILLVLREQEYRKYKSNNKPSYVNNKD